MPRAARVLGADVLPQLYGRLYDRYGDLHWWPARSPYEVMVGAVLTQNTAWRNVEKAIARFGDRLSPRFVEEARIEDLAEIIRPAGFFNQKAAYLKTLTAWFKGYGYSVRAVRPEPLAALRAELLALRGVGAETADAVLLYAFGFPVFVADAYALRLLSRLTASGASVRLEEARALFTAGLDASLYGNAHAMIVANAKAHCRAKPVCAGCPLADLCETQRENIS
ncbi:MAG: endonuclease [Clostridiales Family XIII bacterium]|nr:endonuclease [Clostridiales Family XIII bacterium]